MAKMELIEVRDVLSVCCQAPVWRMGLVQFCGLCLMEQPGEDSLYEYLALFMQRR